MYAAVDNMVISGQENCRQNKGETGLNPPVKYFTDRSKMVLL